MGNDYLGKKVVAKQPNGKVFCVGTVVAYCDVPTFTIRIGNTDTVLHWRSDMCELYVDTVKVVPVEEGGYQISLLGKPMDINEVVRIIKESIKERLASP